MHFRTVFVGLSAALLVIIPSFAQDSAASQGYVAISGSRATLANDVLTIEGVPAVLPTLIQDADPDFYPTNEMAAAWAAAVQIANGEMEAPEEGQEIDLEATIATARLIGKQGIGNDFIDYSATLNLTSAAFDSETSSLTLNISDLTVVSATNKDLIAIKSPKLPDELLGFVLYIDLTPEFLDALAIGAPVADAALEGQGRPSGAKPCRPTSVRRC